MLRQPPSEVRECNNVIRNLCKSKQIVTAGSEEVRLLTDGFYEYDQDKRTYYVPDGDWFSYSDQWPSSEISLTDRSEKSATFVLNGIDLTENERNIQFDFSISTGKLLLEKRTILD